MKTEVTCGKVKYEVGVDENGNDYAKTYNEKYKVWVKLMFAPVENIEAIQSALEILKQDYIEKALKQSAS